MGVVCAHATVFGGWQISHPSRWFLICLLCCLARFPSPFRRKLTPVRCLSSVLGPRVGLFVAHCGGLAPVRYLLVGLGVCWSVGRSVRFCFVCLFVCSLLSSCFFLWVPPRRAFFAGNKDKSGLGSCAIAPPPAEIEIARDPTSITWSLVSLGISYRVGKALIKCCEV